MYLYLGFALFAVLLANQNPINADFKKVWALLFITSAISNLVGSIFLGIITVTTTRQLFQVLGS